MDIEGIIKIAISNYDGTYIKELNDKNQKGIISINKLLDDELKESKNGTITFCEDGNIVCITKNKLSDMTDAKKEKLSFGTPKELVNKTINTVSLVDKLNNSYLSEEIKAKGINMDKVNSYIDKIESMDEVKYLAIFNDYIYHVKEKTAFSHLYIADKFLDKKASIREEFNKLDISLGNNVDDIKSK